MVLRGATEMVSLNLGRVTLGRIRKMPRSTDSNVSSWQSTYRGVIWSLAAGFLILSFFLSHFALCIYVW